MISPEIVRRYPFFAGLDYDRIVTLAKLGEEITVEKEVYLFQEGDILDKLYLVVEGSVAIVLEVPDRNAKAEAAEQIMGEFPTKDVLISSLGPGEVVGWSAIIPPHQATAGAKALTPCRLIAFDAEGLRTALEEDATFGYQMTRKVAQIMRERLQDTRIQMITWIHSQ